MSMTRREILWDCIWTLLDDPYRLDEDKKQGDLISYIKELDAMMPEDKEDYALVPVEPTEEMIAAAHHEVDQAAIHNYGGPADPMDIWQAMIAAATETK